MNANNLLKRNNMENFNERLRQLCDKLQPNEMEIVNYLLEIRGMYNQRIAELARLKALHAQQLSECWDNGYSYGWVSGKHDDAQDDGAEKAKSTFISKQLNTKP